MQEYEEIDLLELIKTLWKRKWIIIACVILAALMAFSYTRFAITPMYESKTTLMVNGSKSSGLSDIASSFDLGSINMSQKLVVTYSEIVQSRIVLEQVINRLELDLTYGQLLERITSVPVKNTEILQISVKHEDPEQAALIANTITDVFIKEVMRIIKADNVEIIDKAIGIYTPINVKLIMNVAIGGILGGMVGVGIIFLIILFDRTLKTAEDIEKHLGLPVLGTIVDFKNLETKHEVKS
ncbi:Capsular polysaccharide biosynthesis protein [Petrocella atlantisensis]|uniref:Capsular polysaccharide biosynthesis protein n=1 Tax=Petrocella atlantisensis TaxID=2173034 RepID=A0A3P7PBF2_9FIRM|nr:Wzz/FepE/Etk N-terminal domain-containing protein [Petrocella atlantisensis]VDN46228.1 Capsular polysaccharide biosynthesis protein [Petrocella atlantisensis]